MIDLHSHILPNIDDGSTSPLETFMMLKQAEKVGFTDIFATPHYISGITEQEKQEIQNKIDEVNQASKEQGIHVKVHMGEEIYGMPDVIELIKNNKLCTLNSSKYVLIEFGVHLKPTYMENMIYDLCNLGYVPIIAHPERYEYVKENINLVANWQNMGALIQCNYGSLLGKYGHVAQKVLISLLKSKQVDFMGTDSHRAGSVYDDMFEIIKKINKIVDDTDYIELITTINAKKILL